MSSYHLLRDVDVVRLHVEDELVLGPLLLEGLRVVDLVGADLVAVAEDLVEREQRGGHAAAAAEEVAPGQPLALRGPLADLVQPGLVFLLLGRLRRRDELLVRGDPRRDRRRSFALGVEIALTNPHGRYSGERGDRRFPVRRVFYGLVSWNARLTIRNDGGSAVRLTVARSGFRICVAGIGRARLLPSRAEARQEPRPPGNIKNLRRGRQSWHNPSPNRKAPRPIYRKARGQLLLLPHDHVDPVVFAGAFQPLGECRSA